MDRRRALSVIDLEVLGEALQDWQTPAELLAGLQRYGKTWIPSTRSNASWRSSRENDVVRRALTRLSPPKDAAGNVAPSTGFSLMNRIEPTRFCVSLH